MKTKWTPGPWRFGTSRGALPLVWDSKGNVICRLGEGIDESREIDRNAQRNGPLIALAPELAEALRDILAAHDWPTEPHWTRARSLLARLEGGEANARSKD